MRKCFDECRATLTEKRINIGSADGKRIDTRGALYGSQGGGGGSLEKCRVKNAPCVSVQVGGGG